MWASAYVREEEELWKIKTTKGCPANWDQHGQCFWRHSVHCHFMEILTMKQDELLTVAFKKYTALFEVRHDIR